MGKDVNQNELRKIIEYIKEKINLRSSNLSFILFNQAKIIGATYLISYILFFIIMEVKNC